MENCGVGVGEFRILKLQSVGIEIQNLDPQPESAKYQVMEPRSELVFFFIYSGVRVGIEFGKFFSV